MSNPYGEHVPDPTRPSGFRWRRRDEPDVTQIQPVVGSPDRVPPDHDLQPVPTSQFPSYDDVDSTTIVDPEAPA